LTKKKDPPAEAPKPIEGLAGLRVPFEKHQVSSLPKQTKAQKIELEKDRNKGIRCALCGGWHHKDAMHVPYVGHAAVTDRLLEVDPNWNWEPLGWTDEGLPRFDATGGLWIKLTVCGMSRYGYGHGAQKPSQEPGAREKEVIGDALRNAAMRFGAALDLWHKGDLHGEDVSEDEDADAEEEKLLAYNGTTLEGAAPAGLFIDDEQRDRILKLAEAAGVEARAICERYGIDALPQLHADRFEELMGSLKLTAEQKAAARKPAFADRKKGPQPEPESPQHSDVLDDDVPFL
jgi:hypothetical protein